MNCYCCSIKKKLFESFVELDTENGTIYLCAKCNDLLYKIRDDYNDGNKKLNSKHIRELQSRENNPQEIYITWKTSFIENNTVSD